MANAEKPKVPFPGIPGTSDGAGTVVWVETNICQGACAYPITSSTTMGGGFQSAVSNGYKNLWGETLAFIEPESEHSSASSCEGFAVAGGRVTNFTSGQGLILMKEVLYTISGKRLPVVFHIGARALTSQGLNVHAGHDDVMGVADTGWGIVFAKNAQESGDLALIARRAAEASETPFLNVQDGFLTTHTVENVLYPEKEMMKNYVGDAKLKIRNLMDVKNPIMSGVVQNQDSYMKGKIAQRYFYQRVPNALKEAFDEFYALTGRKYDFLELYKMADAEYALVSIAGMSETAMAAVDWIREKKGVKVGVVNVWSYRPFPGAEMVNALKNCKAVSVLERMDDPLAPSNPLTRDIKAAFSDALTGVNHMPKIAGIPKIYSAAAGLGSRDVRAGHFWATVQNMMAPNAKQFFCLGIKHPLAVDMTEDPDVRPPGAFSMRGHSVGGFGSVTTNKVIATIAGEVFGLDVQAYPKYGSEKKGLPTTYYLTIAKEHVRTHCELEHIELVVLNDINAFNNQNPVDGLTNGGAIFMQADRDTPEKVWESIPAYAKRHIREKNIRVYYMDMVGVAREVCSSPDLLMRMQGVVLVGVFMKVTPYQKVLNLTDEQIFAGIEKVVRKYWGKRGDKVVNENMAAITRGFKEFKEIPQAIIKAAAAPQAAAGE
ncbi:MAG: 2-oxoacid:acceptor oxidoreductase family protein [Planctomycetes bacterium]|nr:2-oxoacid:acceptor oxidoreductase family protein [Planctomycetota bacterium]